MRKSPHVLVAESGRVVLPGATIGVLGGGQLGRMLAIDGRKMGYRFITLDPTADSPCGQAADEQIVASYADVAAAERLADESDVITYEFENVDARVASVLEQKADVPQGSQLLYTTQHRLREKRAVEAAGAPVAPYRPVWDGASLHRAVAEVGLPAVLKTTTGGYDGKGQWMIESPDVAEAALGEWADRNREAAAAACTDDPPLVLEQKIPFVKELSVVVARSRNGEIASFPVAENVHVHHILHLSMVPAAVPGDVLARARQLAEGIAAGMGAVGLLAVEMFLGANDELYVNELAPRPHNSGHYTQDACATSQFEQHIRAICGLPLGDTRLLTPVVMANILGQHTAPFFAALPMLPGNVKVHWYGKVEAKRDRKMGHINVLADSVQSALSDVRALGIWGDQEA